MMIAQIIYDIFIDIFNVIVMRLLAYNHKPTTQLEFMSDFFYEQDDPSSSSDEGRDPSVRVDGSQLSSGPKSLQKNKYVHKIRDLGA